MTNHLRLIEKLGRQRASLLTDWNFSLTPPSERALYADPADQASSDFEQDLAMQVRMRMIARLKRIERTAINAHQALWTLSTVSQGDFLYSTGGSTECSFPCSLSRTSRESSRAPLAGAEDRSTYNQGDAEVQTP
jgi:hypothetical protein